MTDHTWVTDVMIGKMNPKSSMRYIQNNSRECHTSRIHVINNLNIIMWVSVTNTIHHDITKWWLLSCCIGDLQPGTRDSLPTWVPEMENKSRACYILLKISIAYRNQPTIGTDWTPDNINGINTGAAIYNLELLLQWLHSPHFDTSHSRHRENLHQGFPRYHKHTHVHWHWQRHLLLNFLLRLP